MKVALTTFATLFSTFTYCQQWGGSTDVNGNITRNGNIVVNGLYSGRYGSSLAGDSNPYQFASSDNEIHDLVVYGGGGVATLNLRLYDGDLKLGSNSVPNTILSNNGSASFGGVVSVISNQIRFSETRGLDYDPATDAMFYNGSNNGQVVKLGDPNGNAWFNGRMGIGSTASAVARLHVIQSGGGWTDGMRLSLGSRNWDFVSDTNGDRLLIARDQNSNQGIAILNGNLGVGVSNPANKLEVSNGSQVIRLLTGTNTSSYLLDVGVNDNGVNFSNNSAIRGYNFQNVNGNLMTIQSNGNIGMGTTAPDAKLSVKGQVHAQEVKVDLNGAIAPDYVFRKDYKLASLEEIRSYIEQNQHLPEVPSALEMETNGINVGEMNLLLLKKVEELTLYVIELKEENRRQQQAINQISTEVKHR